MNSTQLTLPGIQPELVAASQIRWVDASSAQACCGLNASGILIPYFDPAGAIIMDQGKPFYRLRLDAPTRDGQKYHQLKGTSPHGYLPPGTVANSPHASTIVIIEGEKKALSLADLYDIAPIGIGGFYGFSDNDHLVPEVGCILAAAKDAKIVFVGDRDVIFNYQFSHAACRLAKLLSPRQMCVTCVPWDSPGKGMDDCREFLKDAFGDLLHRLLDDAIPVDADTEEAPLAVDLLKKKLQVGSSAGIVRREEAATGFSELLASLFPYPLQYDLALTLAHKCTGIARRTFSREAQQIRTRQTATLTAERNAGAPPHIDLAQPSGVWTAQVLERIAWSTFVFGKSLGVTQDGVFRAFTPQSLAPYVDSPERCRFVRTDPRGIAMPKSFGESEARLLLGSVTQNAHFVRPVTTISRVPVLVCVDDHISLVTGYDRE